MGRPRVAIKKAEEYDVDILGRKFTVAPLTRAITKQGDAIEDQMSGIKDDDGLVALIGELLDLRLTPVAPERKEASKVVVDLYESDDLNVPQLLAFTEGIAEADRPR